MKKSEGAAVLIPPPILFALPSALGIALGRSYPLPLPLAEAKLLTAFVTLPLVLGIFCIAASFVQFWSTGQSPEPRSPATGVLQNGIYRYTRNPIYLGMALLQVALGIERRNFWIVGLVVVSLALVRQLAILPEEVYLEKKFGEEYRAYQGTVGRWL